MPTPSQLRKLARLRARAAPERFSTAKGERKAPVRAQGIGVKEILQAYVEGNRYAARRIELFK